MPSLSPIIIAVLVIVVAVLLIAMIYARNYIKVPPNVVAVFTGRGKMKIVRGGARFKIPVLERVDMMSLEPFNIQVEAPNSRSVDGVGISVSVVALVRFGSTEEAIATATERFLTADRAELKAQLQEVIAGNMRAVCATMTVEKLNTDREALRAEVMNEAGSALAGIGMQLDVLTIQNINDGHGYMDALGRKRVAEVKRDAEIGEAEAQRDSQIRSAKAIQEGKTAQAEADAAVADSQRTLQLKQASIATEVEAAKARASQAGPQARAEAERAVVLAGVETERQQTEAQIQLEQQRAARQQQAVQADVVIPAEAQRQAAVAKAQGERDAAISAAEADAKRQELEGAAVARTRTLAADATRRELEAKAAGELALLSAQAEGQEKLAEALNKFGTEAARLNVLPQLISMLPELARAIAEGVDIDKMVVIDGGGNGTGSGAFARAASTTPQMINVLREVSGALGINLDGMLGGIFNSADSQSAADATSLNHNSNSVEQPKLPATVG